MELQKKISWKVQLSFKTGAGERSSNSSKETFTTLGPSPEYLFILNFCSQDTQLQGCQYYGRYKLAFNQMQTTHPPKKISATLILLTNRMATKEQIEKQLLVKIGVMYVLSQKCHTNRIRKLRILHWKPKIASTERNMGEPIVKSSLHYYYPCQDNNGTNIVENRKLSIIVFIIFLSFVVIPFFVFVPFFPLPNCYC